VNKSAKPIISIVTCTYNSEKYLEKALRSVEKQTYKNIEHIFNDSYSTDSTLEIIKKYTEKNKDHYPIKFIQSPPKGVANALNVATKEATGNIIHYLHADDYYYKKDSLEKVAKCFIKDSNLVWLTGNCLVEVKGRRITIPVTHFLKANPQKAISVMNIISHENTFVKTEVIEKYGGFNEKEKCTVEYSLWLRLIKDHMPLILNDEFTVFIIHKGSTSTGSLIKFSKAVLRAFNTQHKEKIFPFIGSYDDKGFYKKYKKIVRKVQKLKSLIDFDNFKVS